MKSGSHFHFKKFSVAHDRTTHKVGTDGVLVGAWADVTNAKDILEIGTGSGVIALILAQRTSDQTLIDAVEIEQDAASQATENINSSPWPEKVVVHNQPIQNYCTDKKYDLIITNPPFFINSTLPPKDKRIHARHTSGLSFEELIDISIKFLKTDGSLSIILPQAEALMFMEKAGQKELHLIRRCNVQSRSHKPIERILLEFGLKRAETLIDNLVIHGHKDGWSEEYIRLTGDFYLKM